MSDTGVGFLGLLFFAAFGLGIVWYAFALDEQAERDQAACLRMGLTPVWHEGQGYLCSRDYVDPRKVAKP